MMTDGFRRFMLEQSPSAGWYNRKTFGIISAFFAVVATITEIIIYFVFLNYDFYNAWDIARSCFYTSAFVGLFSFSLYKKTVQVFFGALLINGLILLLDCGILYTIIAWIVLHSLATQHFPANFESVLGILLLLITIKVFATFACVGYGLQWDPTEVATVDLREATVISSTPLSYIPSDRVGDINRGAATAVIGVPATNTEHHNGRSVKDTTLVERGREEATSVPTEIQRPMDDLTFYPYYSTQTHEKEHEEYDSSKQ